MTRVTEEAAMARQSHHFATRPLCTAFVILTGYSIAWPATAQGLAADDKDPVARQTLESALLLAGQSIATLPIVLTSIRPDTASADAQGWTSVGRDGRGEQIFLYTESASFRCARPSSENYQCLLKLASVIVHEVWHLRHRGGEAEAYAAQITFLMGHHGALDQIADVRRSRDRAVAVERKAIDAARQRAAQSR
jgi:hypothetical protein